MTSTRRPADKEWVVTLHGGVEAGRAGAALAAAGLQVEHVLAEIGVVTGRGSAGLAEALRRVDGVADVAEQAPVDIGPPDAPVS